MTHRAVVRRHDVPGKRLSDNGHRTGKGRPTMTCRATGNPRVVHSRIRDSLEITRAGACCQVTGFTCRSCRNVVSGLDLQRRRRQSGERG